MSYSMRRKNLVSELNLMVAGNTGLGKTSFIRTLFGTLQLRRSAVNNLATLVKNASLKASTSGVADDKRPTSPTNQNNGIGTKANGSKDSIGYATGPLERTLNSFEALFEIEESNDKINLTLVDTPGFSGSDESIDAHCDEILAYLEYQFDLTLAEERKVRRNPKATDNQIHACIYFIDHTASRLGLSDADIRILSRLGTRVNLIPVIARADTLTRAQTRRLKQAILKDAAEHQIQFFQFLSPRLAKKLIEQRGESADNLALHVAARKKKSGADQGSEDEEEEDEDDDDDDDDDELEEDVLEEKAYLQSLTPFSVIAQEEDVEIRGADGQVIQGREFSWGVVDCLDPNHCDLEGLRSALLSSHRAELKEITYGYFYEKYRTEKLLARTKSQHFQFQQQQQQQLRNGPSGASSPVSQLRNKESMLSVKSGSAAAMGGPWEE